LPVRAVEVVRVVARPHGQIIKLEMRRICNTDATRATGWTAGMSSQYVGLSLGLCPGPEPEPVAWFWTLDVVLPPSGAQSLCTWSISARSSIEERKKVARSIAMPGCWSNQLATRHLSPGAKLAEREDFFVAVANPRASGSQSLRVAGMGLIEGKQPPIAGPRSVQVPLAKRDGMASSGPAHARPPLRVAHAGSILTHHRPELDAGIARILRPSRRAGTGEGPGGCLLQLSAEREAHRRTAPFATGRACELLRRSVHAG
jgi:hypothetical protein